MNGWRWLKGYLRAFTRASVTRIAITIYVVVVLLPGCLLFYFYYRQTSGIIEREMGDSMLQTLNQAEYNISNSLDNVASVSDSLLANQDIIDYLSAAGEPAFEQYWHFQALEKLVASAERNRGIHRIRLFVDPKLTYSREGSRFFPLDALDRESSWYRDMTSRNGAIVWRSTYRQYYLGEAGTDVVSAFRMLHDPLHYETVIGVLAVDVKADGIRDILNRVSLSASQEVYVVDGNRLLVSHPDAQRLGKPADLTIGQMELMADSPEGVFRDDQGTSSFLFRRIPDTDWTIVAKLSTSELSGKSVVLTKISAVLLLGIGSVIFIFFLVLAFAAAAESLSKRIRDMIRTLKAEGSAHFDGSLPKPKGDLRQLESAISRMVQAVHDLTAESYLSKLHERDAQLKALQAQIDPHFLYNTLDSMNWMAIRRGAGEISDLIEALSTYFRLSLNKGRDVVTLAEELQLIRSYMHIHNTRDDKGIAVVYDVEEPLLSYRLPKLTLQPIVENAVLHGIQHKRPKSGTIVISARLEGPWLLISVEDDGVGMTRERLDRLLEPRPSGETAESYGLYNVHERLRLFSHDNGAGVTMFSEPGRGTKALLKIKIAAD
ncbi:cache domain-containing sensor histidine kinase [Paenibacillus nasutitermitis]|uniref:Histidine kinase n=1 Tax=Paenibacillus nasutitermitis TaxID=1652958 RepID=A0A917E1P9_9BACL|nr:sensor histidine kinase [Paenibacillus nasutitermitis]GGD90899.1 histidine kinase [Paenibacillus nasutitermitis]